MPNKILFACISVFILISGAGHAQYYSSGADPASIRWEQIDTERFRLVYPEEFSEAATGLAQYLDSVAPMIEATLDHSPRKIDILIHAHSTYSNGFVSWAPRRIELYPNPSQAHHSTDWLKHLALHEYRHVVQIDKLRQGFTKFASWLTGEQAVGAALGAYLPMWFIEGDAVITETTLSQSGRGRLPHFSQPLKARLAEYGRDGYSKAYLGSYRDYVPDYYKTGYFLTSEVRRRYGPELWSEVIDYTGRNSWLLVPFRKKLRKTGYRSPRKIYEAVFDSLQTSWKNYDDTLNTSKKEVIARGHDDYTNFEYPVSTSNGDVFAEISGPGQRTRIVKMDDAGEPKTIAYTGNRKNGPITANERWVAWAESKPHLRWPNADFSIIRLHDRSTGQTSTLKSKTRYFSPALDPESSVMAVVETTSAYEFFITLINTETGEELQRISTPANTFPFHPSWSDAENELVLVLQDDNGKRIVTLNTDTHEWKTLRSAAGDEPKFPQKEGDQLWFTASTQNSEEIFRMNLSSGTTDQVTRSRFGSTSPAPSHNNKLLYSDYTPRGYQLVQTDRSQSTQSNVSPANLDSKAVQELIDQEPESRPEPNNKEYQTESYSKWNLFNLHSWAPAYFETDAPDLYPGLTLMSQNLLGTAVTRMGYNAARSETREKFNAGFTYRGFFPVLDFDVKWGDFQEDFPDMFANNEGIFTLQQEGKGQQIKVETGIRTPLSLSSGKWSRTLQPRVKLSWQNISNQNYEQTFYSPDFFGNLRETGETKRITIPDLDYWGMEYSLYFHNKLRGTSRDVNTRWGQSISLTYRHTP
ncbi:MAG: TolB family protein, partial [Marinilabiliaceae bacterium]